MATDFSKPVVTDAYATLLPRLVTANKDLARMLEPTLTGTSTNVPTGVVRWNAGAIRWERYNGTAWVTLPTAGDNIYALSISGNAATATTAAACSGNSATATTAAACSGNSATATTAAACTGNAATATNAAGAFTVPGTLTVGNTTNSSISMVDTDEGARTIQCNSNLIGFMTQAGGWGSYCDESGNWVAAGNVTAYSDERRKTNWQLLPLDFVDQLARVKSGIYDRTDMELTQVGVSAQSLQSVLPEAVLTDKSGYLSVAYGNAALTACIELAKEVTQLRSRLAALECRP